MIQVPGLPLLQGKKKCCRILSWHCNEGMWLSDGIVEGCDDIDGTLEIDGLVEGKGEGKRVGSSVDDDVGSSVEDEEGDEEGDERGTSVKSDSS